MLLFDVVILWKLLVDRRLFAQNAASSCCLAVTLDPISNSLDLFRIRLGKIPKPGMAGWNDHAICADSSAVFTMGWLDFHRQAVN